MTDKIKERFGREMNNIQIELEGFEEEPSPSDEDLIDIARHETFSALGVIEIMQEGDGRFLEENLSKLESEMLKIRVALEMVRGYR